LHDPSTDGIADSRENNWDAVSSCLSRLGSDRSKSGDKHIGLHPNEVGRKVWRASNRWICLVAMGASAATSATKI
jgi:hypothetical protein